MKYLLLSALLFVGCEGYRAKESPPAAVIAHNNEYPDFTKDSTIAYIKYNADIKKYAVYARYTTSINSWGYLIDFGDMLLPIGGDEWPFKGYDTKEKALKDLKKYISYFREELTGTIIPTKSIENNFK